MIVFLYEFPELLDLAEDGRWVHAQVELVAREAVLTLPDPGQVQRAKVADVPDHGALAAPVEPKSRPGKHE